jgi:tropomyosin
MESLRVEADESHAKSEELSTKVKTLEQQNLQQEQEITSLQHRNSLLESEVEKLEGNVKEHKEVAAESTHHSTQNETLTRRLQILEDEAEESDKSLREANEK